MRHAAHVGAGKIRPTAGGRQLDRLFKRSLGKMAGVAGFEPATPGFVDRVIYKTPQDTTGQRLLTTPIFSLALIEMSANVQDMG